ncbi:tetratricopeptide repeat protein 12 [Hypomesus transpacificus]|uniref:tetratricopeptide repeat protein 12 n=1 Tax=Hypomesus transpacificus TaxID=137520 RepID=UPI001F076F16|nr:tetratricopeptide repeat protein 12 [Hypomesus transpacificus]
MNINVEDLESFLKNVDKISDLVKGLSSSDVDVQQRSAEKADHYIAALEDKEPCKTRINKTRINTNTSQPDPASQTGIQDSSRCPGGFLKVMEEDAAERSRTRKVNEMKANALKQKGNEAFALEDYEAAVQHYSAGLEELRDMQPLYTNRAQAYIKLGRFKQAIEDCEWALKCDERCVKAFLHMGRARLALRDYNQARSSYRMMVEIDPSKASMVQECLFQVDQEEQREEQERHAWEEMERGEEKARRVPQLLEKLSRPDQIPLYYCGGLQLLAQAITDCSSQTVFRLNNGFSVVNASPAVSRCLSQRWTDPGSQELCAALLQLWRVVCDGNDENHKLLLGCRSSSLSIVLSLASHNEAVVGGCLELLCSLSRTRNGRNLAIDSLNLHMLAAGLVACVSKQTLRDSRAALTVLQNFALENKFRLQLRATFNTSVGPHFTSILRNITPSNRGVLPSLLSTIDCMASDDVIRQVLADGGGCWESLLVAMERCSCCEYREVLYPLLGLVIKLSSRPSTAMQEHAVPLSRGCVDLLTDTDGGIITRATGVLSVVLPHSPAAVQLAVQAGVVSTMRRLLKSSGQTSTRFAIKTLAVCTAASTPARQELLAADKRLSVLRGLLSSRPEEVVLGNAALVLAHCVGEEGAASSLLGTDVVLLLLRLAGGDVTGTSAQRNAAIALGTLCRAEPRHMAKLRELHGLQILHSCMKLIT